MLTFPTANTWSGITRIDNTKKLPSKISEWILVHQGGCFTRHVFKINLHSQHSKKKITKLGHFTKLKMLEMVHRNLSYKSLSVTSSIKLFFLVKAFGQWFLYICFPRTRIHKLVAQKSNIFGLGVHQGGCFTWNIFEVAFTFIILQNLDSKLWHFTQFL